MATFDDIDPAQASRRANDQLRIAITQLDEHIQALTAPTMELAVSQRRRMAETGLEELEPSALIKKFVSQAGPGAQIGSNEPGKPNPDASVSDASIKEGWERFFSGQRGQPGKPGMPPGLIPEGGSAIAGKTNVEAERIAAQGFQIPQFGDWQLDSLLRVAAHAAGGRAMKRYKSQAESEFEQTETALSPEEWQKTQGRFASSNLAQKFESGATRVAEASLIHKKILSPLLDIGFGASNAGASLGFSPQNEGLGVFGASHLFGIPNPIAAFTSPAAKQGLGSVVNAAEAAIGGTGIGLGEANNLRQALAQQGWSNQRAGGMLGFTVGGEQETLALALEPLMKRGFKNPEVLSEFTSALKLGTGNIGELTKGIENLAETAKATHQTLEAEAVKAQEFMAKAVEGGSTMIHGLTAYGEIAKATKMNPLLVQGINEGQFGQIQALSKGILPWEIQSMSGNAAALNAWETVRKVAGYVPKQTDTRNFNKITGKWEVTESAAEKETAYIHMLEPSITAEQAKRLKEIGPRLEAITGGLGQGRTIHAAQFKREEEAIGMGNAKRVMQAHTQYSHENAYVEQLERELKGHPNEERKEELEEKIERAKENRNEKHNELQSALEKAKRSETLKGNAWWETKKELEGPHGLYHTAELAAKGNRSAETELTKIKKEALKNQTGSIMNLLEGLNKVNVEKEKEENAKIELSGPAKAFFKLKFPGASAQAEQNEGGPSTASKAAQPNAAGETASEQSLMKTAERAMRGEPTTAR